MRPSAVPNPKSSSTKTGVFRANPFAAGIAVGLLVAPREQQLINRLSEFPEIIATCATELSPHLMAFYLRDLSADFHAFYNSERVLVDDLSLRQARLLLLASVGQVLRAGLGLLGVSAPNRL